MSFGERLRELRKENNLTLRQLAKRADVDFGYLSKIENDKEGFRPAEKLIRSLAEILHAIVNAAEGTCREATIAPGLVFRSAFKHKDRYAVFDCRMGGTEGRVSGTDNDDVARRRQHAFQPILLLRRRLAAFGPVARLDFASRDRHAANRRVRDRTPQIHEFSRDQRLTKVQKRSNQDALTMLKVGTDVNFSQSDTFVQ